MLERQDTYYVTALERIFQDRYSIEYPLAIVNACEKKYVVGKCFVTKDLYNSVFKSTKLHTLLDRELYSCMHFLDRLNQDFNDQCNFRLMHEAVVSAASEIWNGNPGYSEIDVMQEKKEEARYGLAKDWCSTRGFSIGHVPPFRFCADLEDIRRYIDTQ